MGKRGPKPRFCLPGEQYGRLTVIGEAEHANDLDKKRRQVLCNCECGNEKVVRVASLMNGLTKSCGCLHDTHRLKHGHSSSNGATLTYSSWQSMKTRCTNPDAPNYAGYGGRGIRVCERWEDFESFLEDMGERPSPRHSIDRIDGDGDYEPTNCRWASPKQQARNRRNNRIITYNGETHSLAEWADRVGLKRTTLQARLSDLGYTVEEALTLPLRGKRNG